VSVFRAPLRLDGASSDYSVQSLYRTLRFDTGFVEVVDFLS
jgi:hypothetical protein